MPYVTAFLETMLREWHGTDKLRLDKFYTLVRRSMRSIYYVAFRPDFADRSSDLIDTVSRLILANTDAKSRGLTLHVADVLVDEVHPQLFHCDVSVMLTALHSLMGRWMRLALVRTLTTTRSSGVFFSRPCLC